MGGRNKVLELVLVVLYIQNSKHNKRGRGWLDK